MFFLPFPYLCICVSFFILWVVLLLTFNNVETFGIIILMFSYALLNLVAFQLCISEFKRFLCDIDMPNGELKTLDFYLSLHV